MSWLLNWAKNKVSKWFRSESNQKALLDYGMPLLLRALAAFAAKTKNTYDDKVVREMENWWNTRK